MEFEIPLNFKDLREESARVQQFEDFSDCSEDYVLNKIECKCLFHMKIALLRGIANEADVDRFEETVYFDNAYNLVSSIEKFDNQCLSELTDMMHTMCNAAYRRAAAATATGQEVDTPLKNALKMSVYLLYVTLSKVEVVMAGRSKNLDGTKKNKKEKKKAGDGFDWDAQRIAFLSLLLQVLKMDMTRLWTMGVADEEFLNLFWKSALCTLNVADAMRHKDTKPLVFDLLKTITSQMSNVLAPMTSALIDLMTASEHVPQFVAEVCVHVDGAEEVESSGKGTTARPQGLTSSLLCEICRMNMTETNKTAGAVKNLSAFLADVSFALPSIVMLHVPLLLPHLDTEPHTIRTGVAQCLGNICARKFNAETEGEAGLRKATQHTQAAAEAAAEEAADADGAGGQGADGTNGQPAAAKFSNRSRDTLLNVLVERVHDTSSFARAGVLKVWVGLVEQRALPYTRIGTVTEIAADRLQDKSSLVRKAAMQLLSVLLENNPLTSNLDDDMYKERAADVKQWLVEQRVSAEAIEENLGFGAKNDQADKRASKDSAINKKGKKNNKSKKSRGRRSGDSDDDEDEEEDEVDQREEEDEEQGPSSSQDGTDEEENDDEEDEEEDEGDEDDEEIDTPEIAAKKRELEFCLSAISFINGMKASMPSVELMLGSRAASDVVEALHFFARAMRFNVPGSAKAIQKSLSLIWHPDQAIRDECVATFLSVFVRASDAEAGAEASLSPRQVADNLIQLVVRCTTSETASMERIVAELVAQKKLHNDVFVALWAVVSDFKAHDGEATQSAFKRLSGALLVLSMGAVADPSIVDSASKLQLLLETGFGAAVRTTREWDVVRSAGIVLQRVGFNSEAKSSSKVNAMVALADVIKGTWCSDDRVECEKWFRAAEEAVIALYYMSPQADEAMSNAIISMYNDVYSAGGSCSSVKLARFMFVLGQAALRTLLFAEKLANDAKKAREAAQQNTNKSSKKDEEEQDSLAAELGMNAALEAEEEKQLMRIAEVELVCENLLGPFTQVITTVAANQNNRFSDPILRDTSVMTLCKYMCVSSAACEEYLPLLFTILAKEPLVSVRATIMVALGDLAFRFPNAVEPWTEHIYARLADESLVVKHNCLMVLTHLILNDMVKVKGQVSNIVLCLEDPDPRISDLAKMFFQELSKRSNNPIYNLMPDIIGNLSNMELPAKDTFRRVMAFLLGFIKREKQAESLVEKLCVRISGCASVRQQRDLAYCMAQLGVPTEKAVRRLHDLLRTYKDALVDDDVYSHFKSLINKARKASKTEGKEVLDDWERAIDAAHRGEDADEPGAVAPTEPKPVQAPKRTRARAAPARKPKKLAAIAESDSDDDDGEEDENENEDDEVDEVLPTKAKASSRRRQPLAAVNL